MIRALFIFIIVSAGLVVTLYLVFQKTQFFSKAGTDDAPQKIHITNVTDTAFTVSWITQKQVIGFISFNSQGSGENTINDDRDQSGPKPRFTHHVTLKHLNPATSYSFKIGSGSKVTNNNGEPFEQSTAPISSNTPPLAQPIFGKILKANKQPESEALIYVSIPGSTPLSSYTKDNGNFLITLTNARTVDLVNYIEVQEGSGFDLFVESVQNGNAKQSVRVNTHEALPDIILDNQVKKPEGDLNSDGVVNSMDRIKKKS